MEKTKKNFRLTLNNWYNTRFKVNNRILGNTRRGYGSYLYSQDRIKFDMLFSLWEVTDTKAQFEAKG